MVGRRRRRIIGASVVSAMAESHREWVAYRPACVTLAPDCAILGIDMRLFSRA